MADMNVEDGMYTYIKNVPSWLVLGAVDWHNSLSGDEWNATYQKHPDIQHRIGLLCDRSNGQYGVVNGKFVEYESIEC